MGKHKESCEKCSLRPPLRPQRCIFIFQNRYSVFSLCCKISSTEIYPKKHHLGGCGFDLYNKHKGVKVKYNTKGHIYEIRCHFWSYIGIWHAVNNVTKFYNVMYQLYVISKCKLFILVFLFWSALLLSFHTS